MEGNCVLDKGVGADDDLGFAEAEVLEDFFAVVFLCRSGEEFYVDVWE